MHAHRPFRRRGTESRNHGVGLGLLAPVALWLVTAAFAADVHATVIVPAEFTEMVAGSQTIVHGVVTGVEARLVGSRRTIESVVTVDVIDSLKGDRVGTTSFRIPGGQVGRYRRVMVGAPQFAEGEEVVLFLSGRAPAMPMPFGLSQGVYRVTRTTGPAVVTPLVVEGRVVRGDPARRPIAIDAFAAAVRAIVEREP